MNIQDAYTDVKRAMRNSLGDKESRRNIQEAAFSLIKALQHEDALEDLKQIDNPFHQSDLMTHRLMEEIEKG